MGKGKQNKKKQGVDENPPLSSDQPSTSARGTAPAPVAQQQPRPNTVPAAVKQGQPTPAASGSGPTSAQLVGGGDAPPSTSQPKSRNKYKKVAVPAEAVITPPTPSPAPSADSIPRDVRAASVSSTTTVSSTCTEDTSQTKVIPSAAAIVLAPHKPIGKSGRNIFLDVNYLPLNIQKLVPCVYHYDVNIEPNMPKRHLPAIFEIFRKNNFPKTFLAFDGQKSAYSSIVLNLNSITNRQVSFEDEESSKPRVYMVMMKEVKTNSKIDMKSLHTYEQTRQFDQPARALQAIEVILKAVFLNQQGVGVGRAFYKPLLTNGQRHDLGDSYDMWTGLFQSTVLGYKPFLNVDIAHKAFPRPCSLVDMIGSMGGDPNRLDARDRIFERMKVHLKGLRLRYEVRNHPQTLKSYKFNDFRDPPSQHKFKNDEGKVQTVAQYMMATYGVKLQFPNLPTVWVGSPERTIYVPLEFCHVSNNQAVMKKCTEMQTRNMIKYAATSTDVRRKKIMDLLKSINHNACPTLNQFGVNVGTEFATIPARILAPPVLEYANTRTVTPVRGVWNAAGQFLFPMKLQRWAILVLDQRAHEGALRDFIRMIVSTGANYNMTIAPDPKVIRLGQGFRENDIDKNMHELKRLECALLFCILPTFGNAYAQVKQAAEIRCGILTQCIKESTLSRKGNDLSTISNILLKVNAKLNGTNHKMSLSSKLAIQRRPHMVIGADVTHPSPDQTRIPSVVGVAVSYDPQSFRYRMCWRLQNPKQEMIQDLEEILVEQLRLFEAVNKMFPEYMFYYRDGVSEGQFQEVLRVELNAMYRACARVKPGYKPKIVFVVVQKRHHTRFFPKQPNPKDRNNNVEPGTIVDSQITHPNETQFFLVSHASIQGVAKPTKYCLLRDDANMTMDDLETFTYNLCHLFTRCNRAVSYPAPTYYAHLAAYRGRVYIEGRPINMDKLDKEYSDRKISDAIVNGNPMYFV